MSRTIAILPVHDQLLLREIYQETEASVAPMASIMQVLDWADHPREWAQTMSRQTLLLCSVDAAVVGWIALVWRGEDYEAHVCRWSPIHARTCLALWELAMQWKTKHLPPGKVAAYIPTTRPDVARLATWAGMTPTQIGDSPDGRRLTQYTRSAAADTESDYRGRRQRTGRAGSDAATPATASRHRRHPADGRTTGSKPERPKNPTGPVSA